MSDALVRKIEGRHVLAAFLTAFAVLFSANAIFIYYAVSTFGGLDTEDAYRKGLAYNARLEAASRQDELDWRTSLVFDDARSALILKITDRAGAPVGGLAITGRMIRPATSAFDQTLGPFEERPSGVYNFSPGNIERGSWIVDLAAQPTTGSPFHMRNRLWLPPRS